MPRFNTLYNTFKYSSDSDWEEISQVDAERNAQISTGLFTLICCRDFSHVLLSSSISVRSALTETLQHFLTLNTSRRVDCVISLHIYDRIRGARARRAEEKLICSHWSPVQRFARDPHHQTQRDNTAPSRCTTPHKHITQLWVGWTYLVFMPSSIFEFRRAVHDSPLVIYHPTENLCIKSACLSQAIKNKPALFWVFTCDFA